MESAKTAISRDVSGKMHHGILFDRRLWEIVASSPFPAPRGFAARLRVLARLASLAQIGELVRRLYQNVLANCTHGSIYSRAHLFFQYNKRPQGRKESHLTEVSEAHVSKRFQKVRVKLFIPSVITKAVLSTLPMTARVHNWRPRRACTNFYYSA